MDVLIFSKDRAFQLYSALETLTNYAKGVNNIYVQLSYSDIEFLEGYKLIGKHFPNVTFIDETEYGFNTTLLTILHQEISTENLFLEVDDNLYFDTLNLSDLEKKFNKSNASKLGVGFDINLFNPKYYNIKNDIAIVDKSIIIDNKIQEMCLNYPFNVSGAIHRLEDIKNLLAIENVKNPIDLEMKGSSSYIFSNYPYNLYNIKEVCRQIHTNNFGKRYEEIFNVKILNNFLLNGEVLDLSSTKLGEYPIDMRWFKGEDIGRFPIFPWEIPPSYHSEIINKRKKLRYE